MGKKKFNQFDNIICISSFGEFTQADVTQVIHTECKGCGGYILEGSQAHYPPEFIEMCFDLFKPAAEQEKPKPDTKVATHLFTTVAKILAFGSKGGLIHIDHISGVMKPFIKEFGIEFDFFDLRPPIDQEQNQGG